MWKEILLFRRYTGETISCLDIFVRCIPPVRAIEPDECESRHLTAATNIYICLTFAGPIVLPDGVSLSTLATTVFGSDCVATLSGNNIVSFRLGETKIVHLPQGFPILYQSLYGEPNNVCLKLTPAHFGKYIRMRCRAILLHHGIDGSIEDRFEKVIVTQGQDEEYRAVFYLSAVDMPLQLGQADTMRDGKLNVTFTHASLMEYFPFLG
jgi:hypothetical protein